MKSPKFFRMTDYNTALLPNEYLSRLEHNTSNEEDWRAQTCWSIGYPGWGVLYHLLLSFLDPEQENIVLETGTNWGSTTIILAQALKDSGRPGHVHTVELDVDFHKKATARIREAGVDNFVTCHQGDSKKVLPELLETFTHIRFAFLDGSHLYDDVLDEFETIKPVLEPNSIVAFDNTYRIANDGEDQRVFGALNEIKRRYGGNLINLPFVSWYTPGLAFWQQEPFDTRAGLEDEN